MTLRGRQVRILFLCRWGKMTVPAAPGGTWFLPRLLHLVRQPYLLVYGDLGVFCAVLPWLLSITRNSWYLNDLTIPCGVLEYGPRIAQAKEEVIPKEV